MRGSSADADADSRERQRAGASPCDIVSQTRDRPAKSYLFNRECHWSPLAQRGFAQLTNWPWWPIYRRAGHLGSRLFSSYDCSGVYCSRWSAEVVNRSCRYRPSVIPKVSFTSLLHTLHARFLREIGIFLAADCYSDLCSASATPP